MVGFSPESSLKLKTSDFLTAGAVSGIITRGLFQPLDVLKIRFQLQVEPVKRTSHPSKYKSMTHAIRCIYTEEGIRAFWKGHIPAQYLSISYGALQFLSYEMLTKQAWNILPLCISENFKPVVNFTCGALAGCCATVGSFPFDVIRTRLVGQGEPKVYKGITQGLRIMFIREGPRSYFKGLLPTLIQIAPNAGAQFAFYKFFQEAWNYCLGKHHTETSVLQSSLCGAAAGIGAKTLVYPLDLIKKRLQIQGFEEARKPFGATRAYNGWLHCARCILREERFFGLYKGLSPSIYKAAFTTGSHFLFYEQICKLLDYFHRST